MYDTFKPAFATSFTWDEPQHGIAAGRAGPITHPEFISPIVARFLADSAAYLGVNRDAHEHVNAPKGSVKAV